MKLLRRTKYDYVNTLKREPCSDCGNRFPPVCMEFDHRDADMKLDSVSSLVGRGASWDRINLEITKCDLLCANCHRIRTASRGDWRGQF